MDGSSALKGLPHVTGEYRFPVTSWEAEQDACRDACAARIRHAAVQQGGIPRGPVTVVELRRTEPMGEDVPAYIYVRAEVAAEPPKGWLP